MAHPKSQSPKATNVDSEIQRMVEYIEQDGLEKVEEIDLKSEEEFIVEKNKQRDKEIILITQYYDRLEDKISKDTKAEFCRIDHGSRLVYLNAQQEILNEIRKTANERLLNARCDENKDAYRKVLTALILQGIFKLLESPVTVRFHEQDKECIDDCIEKAVDTYKKKVNKEIEINKSGDYLPDNCIGGVIVITKSNCVSVDNTLKARLYVVAEKPDSALLPQYRMMLFGGNPNRKHYD